MMNIQPPNKISDETILLFKQVLEDDLQKYAKKISIEQNININVLLELIPSVLSEPVLDRINQKYRDTSYLNYKKELNKYSLNDLKEIAKDNSIKITGTRIELMERISEKLQLKEYSSEELEKAKSFKSKPLCSRKKKTVSNSLESESNHYISDSD